MRILVCPQEFKGSLDAPEVARAIAAGLRDALPDAVVEVLPLADGGPGTVAIVCAATGGTLHRSMVRGPLGDPVEAAFGLLPGNGASPARAVIEAAAAAGLVLVEPRRRDPGRASTFGVGQQIAGALAAGAREVIVGVGGTGTNDGGGGALQALGVRLLDEADRELGPGPLELRRLARIDIDALDPRVREARLRVAADVRNPLLGPTGATAVYGPQKGVTAGLAPRLETALAHWAAVIAHDLGIEVGTLEGAGAGGGLAAGLAAIGATIEGGATLVGDAAGLDEAISRADLVVTGEGRLDSQTGYGKTVAHVAARAAALGRPCVAVAGSVTERPVLILDVEASAPDGAPIAAAMEQGAELVRAAARRLGGRLGGLNPSPAR
jgi:glycerate kinase